MNLGTMDISCMMFDLDGTLIDSVPGYLNVMKGIFENMGLPQPSQSLVNEFMTRGMVAFEKLIPDEEKHPKEQIVRECLTVGRRLSQEMFSKGVDVFSGVQELFEILAEHTIPIAVVTSTERSGIEKKLLPLVRLGIRDALAAVIVIEDAARRKPAPDPLLVCARRMAVAAEKCIYVGDSTVDIRAGNAAGMRTIGVLSGLDDEVTLKCENPTLILPSVNDIRWLF